jgi:ribonuclease HI
MAEGRTFACQTCGKSFTVPQQALDKYPGWTPKICLGCKRGDSPHKTSKTNTKKPASPKGASRTVEENLQVAEVLTRYSGGPFEGVFTDGACAGNPGPGGWGVVFVENNEVVDQRYGHDPQTTNNRMELKALIEAFKLLPKDAEVTVYSDSQLCVNTLNEWAAGWEKRGWRRKGGPIKNLELVKEAYALSQAHPNVTLQWIKAHNGSRWNEYADALATAFLRDTL